MKHSYDTEGMLKRQMRITKMRGTNHTRKTIKYTINETGLILKV